MTMHLVGPWLSTTGKKHGKKKWASSEQKKAAVRLEEEWAELKKRHGIEQEEKKRKRAMLAPVWTEPTPGYRGSTDPKPKSLNTWTTGPVSSKPSPKYSGNNIIGIVVQHKSCLQPVFSKEAAADSAKMRR